MLAGQGGGKEITMTLYLDTNIVIYFIEHHPPWYSKVNARLAKVARGLDAVVISDLTIAECLVGPLKAANAAAEADYRTFFADPAIEILSLTRSACELGAQIRADHKFGLIDSLHLAMAAEHRCSSFLTNDAKLARCTAIPVEVLI